MSENSRINEEKTWEDNVRAAIGRLDKARSEMVPTEPGELLEISGKRTVELAERYIETGDLSKLSVRERVEIYRAVCERTGLDPLTRPFLFLTGKDGKVVLYAAREATNQLRAKHKISTTIVHREVVDSVYVVTARVTDGSGRTEEAIGAVPLSRDPQERANAMKKAETQAKRRATLDWCGLGFSDESEVDDIPQARRIETGQFLGAPPPVPLAPNPPTDHWTSAPYLAVDPRAAQVGAVPSVKAQIVATTAPPAAPDPPGTCYYAEPPKATTKTFSWMRQKGGRIVNGKHAIWAFPQEMHELTIAGLARRSADDVDGSAEVVARMGGEQLEATEAVYDPFASQAAPVEQPVAQAAASGDTGIWWSKVMKLREEARQVKVELPKPRKPLNKMEAEEIEAYHGECFAVFVAEKVRRERT